MDAQLSFSVLGRVRATREGTELRLGPSQQRLTLAVLLLNMKCFVSAEELMNALWGDKPPKSAVNSVRIYVHRIRRLLNELGHPAIVSSIGGGYEMLDQGQRLDLNDFESLLAKGERARHAGDHSAALTYTGEGLALWRGRPLADLPGDWAQKQRHVIEDRYLAGVEGQAVDLLAMGRPTAVISTLGGVAADHPFDERLRELLILAMHRSGRTAEALSMYHETREVFAQELGIDLGASLQRLYMQLLRGG
ncbi:AfsR/SARP family transcriptional regulator [Paractinoplanes brasiliensis]|uniref:DNA-binding SARP family transcriptional activator n=1 Tax=Paractinoplanes brasiliensis TaxID=52695 RepID=A0A4R6JAC2_9ACTN|nr:BTAD domain-containing putative transcriptional regulator [Actinoplanes brasiliensis]TDO32633.1 DNA-binding SARP family transcriptional activator [Actinoplanes brasiliensis]GID33467.1 hypothetical protein Abr02nite_84500 [Actinoplanes brasiliensis]